MSGRFPGSGGSFWKAAEDTEPMVTDIPSDPAFPASLTAVYRTATCRERLTTKYQTRRLTQQTFILSQRGRLLVRDRGTTGVVSGEAAVPGWRPRSFRCVLTWPLFCRHSAGGGRGERAPASCPLVRTPVLADEGPPLS
uniref:Uncharacterized protein n=1 Tax=Rousettus aegyptiacus TaxID=9407 RepID=A0A7J8BAU5_ROUAE|nr:hypothetical protein HJG63_009995 [Rousettus aegyptiacus]